jgi:aspartyl-tRNA(Asn)/glutamyl-tRNA(Gln) amidotransferase subunit B
VERALIYEAKRQQKVLESGGTITQQPLLWDEQSGKTRSMRSKEDSHDYRYFPEPDLSPVFVDEKWIETVRESLPELPAARTRRFMSTFGFNPEEAAGITAEKEIADYFEQTLKHFNNPRLVLNWVRNEILRMLIETGNNISRSPVSSEALAELLSYLDKNDITAQTAKTVLDEMAQSGKSPRTIIDEKGLKQISDSSELESLIDSIIEQNEPLVRRYREGEDKLLAFFIGQVMRATKGQAEQSLTREIILKKLG